jgi:hypothetical protein
MAGQLPDSGLFGSGEVKSVRRTSCTTHFVSGQIQTPPGTGFAEPRLNTEAARPE